MLDQLLAQAASEGCPDEREDAVGADGCLARDAFEEGAQIAASQLPGGLRTDRRALHGSLERPPVVAVRGGTPSAFARVDVVLHEGSHRQGFSCLALARGGVLAECAVTEALPRELAGVPERQRRQRAARRASQTRAEAIEDARGAAVLRRDADAEAGKVFANNSRRPDFGGRIESTVRAVSVTVGIDDPATKALIEL